MSIILDSNDPDFITDEERALLDGTDPKAQEKTAEEIAAEEAAAKAAEEEAAAAAEEKKAKPPVSDDRPLENLRGELARRKAKEAKLEEQNERYDKELREMRAEMAKLRARDEIDREADERVRRAKEQAARPDPDVDPIGAELFDLRQKQARLDEFLEKQDQEKQDFENRKQQEDTIRTEIKALDDFLLEDVTGFKETHPDYDGAAQKVIAAQTKVFKNAGYDDNAAGAMVANMLMQMARKAKADGRSVAEAVYNVATEDLGWVAPSAASNEGAKEEAGEENAAPVKEKPDPVKVAAGTKAKIDALKKAQKVQGLGGKTPNQKTAANDVAALTPEEIADLDDEDFLMMKQDPKTRHLINKRMEELG